MISLLGRVSRSCSASAAPAQRDAAARPAVDRRAFPHGCARGVLPRGGRSRRRGGEPVRARLWPPRGGAAARAAVLSGVPRRHESGRARRRRLQLPGLLGVHVAVVLGAGDGAPPRARQCARRLHLSGDGELRHARAAADLRPARRPRRRLCLRDIRAAHPTAGVAALVLVPRAARRRLEGRPGAAACLAAARASGGAEPRLRADERRDDQGRGLRLRAHRVRSARASRRGGGAWSCSRSPASPASWACSTR